jgi:hypothetical protein
VEAERIASEAGISREAVAATEMPSEEVPEGITDRTPVPAAAVEPPAWDLEEEAGAVAVVAVGGADRTAKQNYRSTE